VITMLDGDTAFDPCGSLPGPGVTVIEASAGTGKTFSLTDLVTRFVAEGFPLSDILAVTFTRMATGELRDRIRNRLVAVEAALGRNLEAGEAPPGGDAVIQLLCRGPACDVAVRRRRLAGALSDFDAATIATTHSFCQLVLHGLGTAGDIAPDSVLLEDPSDLVDQVVDDLYLRWMISHPALPFDRSVAGQAAKEAVRNPDIRIVPQSGSDPPGLLGRLASKAREEVARRLAESGLLTYDQLLFRLAVTLENPERGPLACRRLQERYRVVLVDEFQDTDPVQWRVLRQAFGRGQTSLILIGDPKQAIYAFRGADVYAYLEAKKMAAAHYSLDQNWRSDQPLLDAVAALFSPVEFGHQDIVFRPVAARTDRQDPGIRNAPSSALLRVRMVHQKQPGVVITSGKSFLQKGSLIDWIAGDAAADIATLLHSSAEVRDPSTGEWRSIAPANVAVLTRTNRQAVAVRDALRAHGVPSVVAGLDSVFGSEAATYWLRLLEALQEPTSRARVAAAALTPFIGMAPHEAASAAERRWESVHEKLHQWSAVLAERSVAGLYRTITASEGLPARLLSRPGGDRLITDLGHVAQLLHAEQNTNGLGGPALRAWLAQRIRAASEEQSDVEERSRRLDSDAEAVQVLTVHRAKGLEFGVVYCPYMWDPLQDRGSGPVVFHDPDRAVRTLDVGCPGDDPDARRRYAAHLEQWKVEDRGEDLRALYVAITRACHQVVLFWGRAQHCGRSPLGRLLLSRDTPTGAVGPARSPEPADRLVRSALEDVVARAPEGLVAVEQATGPAPTSPNHSEPDPDDASDLDVARFNRMLDLQWQRASYSSITAAAHGGPGLSGDWVASEPEDPGLVDEPAAAKRRHEDASVPPAHPAEPQEPPLTPSRLSALPGGREIGTFVHRVLQQVDFSAADLHDELETAVRCVSQRGAPHGDLSTLVPGLAAAIHTPLGFRSGEIRLRDIPRGDRLDELSFELPVAGGDRPVGQVSTREIARLVATHLSSTGPLIGYGGRLADPVLASEFRGYLTGSLDLVFRWRDEAGAERWYVADYKTNRLGEPDRPVTSMDYGPNQLDAEMQRRHYPLQALLYLVALHRYLTWRWPAYRPDRHLGGVLYLFLRGMVGPDTPVVDGHRCGVFEWTPAPELVVGLSDLLERGGAL
jgi:exodeoxyribonuclease V beta subunit